MAMIGFAKKEMDKSVQSLKIVANLTKNSSKICPNLV